ncbi:AraC family transcriptional regulator [Mycobacterium sp. PS03-16]|nr:AraC family transcriptional regulator [Mycobacterium sp. PS03-16]
MVLWVHGGTVESDCEGMSTVAGTGDVTMTAQHDLPFEAHTEDLTVTTVLLDPALVAEVATGLPAAHTALPIRFSSFAPVDEAACRLWQETVRYVTQTVLADAASAGPVLLGQASRLLAAATLAAFPNSVTAQDEDAECAEHYPALLRRAVDFIEANAGNEIALADISAAVHISPRAVQYMFRRHLETTPLQYLRRLRLHHAHQDLLSGNPVDDTVTSIAARWGFAHTGRFAVQYRQTYGRSPHETLRA